MGKDIEIKTTRVDIQPRLGPSPFGVIIVVLTQIAFLLYFLLHIIINFIIYKYHIQICILPSLNGTILELFTD